MIFATQTPCNRPYYPRIPVQRLGHVEPVTPVRLLCFGDFWCNSPNQPHGEHCILEDHMVGQPIDVLCSCALYNNNHANHPEQRLWGIVSCGFNSRSRHAQNVLEHVALRICRLRGRPEEPALAPMHKPVPRVRVPMRLRPRTLAAEIKLDGLRP